jgi:hypothetical protein
MTSITEIRIAKLEIYKVFVRDAGYGTSVPVVPETRLAG